MIDIIVEKLESLVKGKYAICLAGSHAKNCADNASDIDLFMIVEGLVNYDERIAVIKSFADQNAPVWISRNIEATPWGGEITFYYQGTPVEVTIRSLKLMDKVISDSIEGNFKVLPATWTANGYYTFVFLSEIDFIKVIKDPDEIIAGYKGLLISYPVKLKNSIIKTFYRRANTWIDNFHYQSAIKREDILFISPLVIHTIMDMIQVIYALNEEYYPGDKKLETNLSKLAYVPNALITNLDTLLIFPKDVDHLQKQKDILTLIRNELREKVLPFLSV